MIKSKIRLGISMRITEAENYYEQRDSIAKEWSKFLLEEFPLIDWVYLPNIEEKITQYIDRLQLNGFILSGGENIGTNKERDITEKNILEYAIKKKYPLLGICRGLQLIYQYYGGRIEQPSLDFKRTHVSTSHYILYRGEKILVNSFHKNRLMDDIIPSKLEIEAICESDKSIEAISGKSILGIMWHPERKLVDQKWSSNLIRKFFHYNNE